MSWLSVDKQYRFEFEKENIFTSACGRIGLYLFPSEVIN